MNTFLISMTPTVHIVAHIYTLLQLITMSYAELNGEINYLKQKHTKIIQNKN